MDRLNGALHTLARALQQSGRGRWRSIRVERPVNVRTAINVGSKGSVRSAVARQETEIRQNSRT